MNIISVESSNIDKEHICCAISDKKRETCISSKKTWIKSQYNNGLVFKELDARGKVFIEYIPADDALCKKIRPNVAISIREISREGIFAGILIMPILPFIEDT